MFPLNIIADAANTVPNIDSAFGLLQAVCRWLRRSVLSKNFQKNSPKPKQSWSGAGAYSATNGIEAASSPPSAGRSANES